MAEKVKPQTLKSRIIKTEQVDWSTFKYIQHNEFKDWTVEAKTRLKHSIITNQFTQPFYVWQEPDTGDIYCLDGKHRCIVLEEMQRDGYAIPGKLPAIFIRCKDKKEAANLVLVYSSLYARVTESGMFDFVQAYDLDLDQLANSLEIPNLDFSKIYGDSGIDFGQMNKELSVEDFTDAIEMKFRFSRDAYLNVKASIESLMKKDGFNSAEDVIIEYIVNRNRG